MFIQKRKVKGVEYLYVVRSVRKPGKNYPVQETVRSYGRLQDRLVEDPQFVEKLEAKLKEPDAKVLAELSCATERKASSVFIGNLPIEAAMKKTGILKTFKGFQGKAEYDIMEIARDLICERITNPASKLSSYTAVTLNRLLPPSYQIHDVYRALSDIGGNLDEAVSRFAKIGRVGKKTTILDYDMTNFYFEIEFPDGDGGLRQFGISKEHRPNPIVQMGLFVDQDGYPVAINVNPGNTGEATTAIPTQKLLAKQGIGSYVYCADAGIGSGAIKVYNNVIGRRYVVAQSVKKMAKDRMEWALSDKGWKRPDGKAVSRKEDCPSGSFLWKEEIFRLDIKTKSGKHQIAERTIVIYSDDTRKWQETVLETQIQRAMKKVENGFTENPNSPDRLVGVTNVTDYGEVAEIEIRSIDKGKILEEKRFHGFYAIATNILAKEMKAMDVIAINAGRWKVESFFRTMKSTVDTRPIYLQNDDSIKAHLLLCTTAVYVLMCMATKLKENGVNATPADIQEALQGMYAVERKGGYELGHHRCSQNIDKVRKEIEKAYEMDELEKEAILHSTMKKILKIARD